MKAGIIERLFRSGDGTKARSVNEILSRLLLDFGFLCNKNRKNMLCIYAAKN